MSANTYIYSLCGALQGNGASTKEYEGEEEKWRGGKLGFIWEE